MGRHRYNPQLEGKEESSERVLNGVEAIKLSDIEFKTMVIRKLNELSENYKKLQGYYKKLTANYMHEKGHRNYQQETGGNEEYNFWTEETVEGIKSRLDEAENWIGKLEDKVEKNFQKEQEKEK